MLMPRSFEVPGVFRYRFHVELAGRRGNLELASGHLLLRIKGVHAATLHIEGKRVTLDLEPWLARRMLMLGGRILGWANLLKKTPSAWKSMQRFADESGARVEFRVSGHRLIAFLPGKKPIFSILSLRSFLYKSYNIHGKTKLYQQFR